MAEPCVLAIDQGTSATKCLLVSSTGTVLRKATAPLASGFPQRGWVEQDAEQLWLSVVQAVRDCTGGVPAGTIAAVGLSTQRESALLWDRDTGTPLSPVIGWPSARSTPTCWPGSACARQGKRISSSPATRPGRS